VIAGQRLTTWALHGDRLADLQEKLRRQPGVEQTVSFGNALHVSGTDAAALQQTVESAARSEGLRAEKIDTSLEDVFIHLMSQSDGSGGGHA
jgi:ABC-2 type transport system ATP-binding protein